MPPALTPRGMVRLNFQTYERVLQEDGSYKRLVAIPKEGAPFNLYTILSDQSVLIPAYTGIIYVRPRHVAAGPEIPFVGQLKDFQELAVSKMLKYLKDDNGAFLNAPCGTGKTVMALSILSNIKPANVLVLVDQTNIAEQWQERVKQFLGTDVEIFSGKYKAISDLPKSTARINIATVQSLMRQDWVENPPHFELLIVDEAHVFSAPAFSTAMTNISFNKSVALTATPDRRDGLEWVFKSLLGTKTVVVPNKAMTAEIRVHHLPFAPDVKSEDYVMWFCRIIKATTTVASCRECSAWESYPYCGGIPAKPSDRTNIGALIHDVSNDPEYMAWLINVITLLHKKKRQVLVFSQHREHLKNLFVKASEVLGIDACGLYLGIQSKSDEVMRENAMRRPITFCTYGVANKALDVPHKDCAIFTTPKSDIRQAKGRIERFMIGKPQPIIIDVVFDHISMFKGMFYSRLRQYRNDGCQIKDTK